MKIMSTDAKEKGGVSLLLYHCFFNSTESITHYMTDIADKELHDSLKNTYVVCVSDIVDNNRKIVAGFFIKTNYNHGDIDFQRVLDRVYLSNPEFGLGISPQGRFLASKLGLEGNDPLTEDEMTKIIMQQFLKYNVDGKA